MESRRRRVSRDTRLLFGIVLIAVATLWVLARIRFPDRVPTPNPVPPVLAQLVPMSAFDDIASTVAQLEPSVERLMIGVDVRRRVPSVWTVSAPDRMPALRFLEGVAIALLDPRIEALDGAAENGGEVVRDPATGLTLVRASGGAVPELTTWSPRQPQSPRFLLAADVQREGTSLRPVFVGSLYPIDSPTWGSLWTLTASPGLVPGTFLFSVDGAFAGLAVARDDGVAIVPADTVIEVAERLIREPPNVPGYVGINVQAMTPEIAAATGAGGGVVVTWVDPEGPAASRIQVTDVIARLGDGVLSGLEDWRVRIARVRAGAPLTLTIWGRDAGRDVQITPAPTPATPRNDTLGLTLRTVQAVGAEVVSVEPGSAAFRAGIVAGDLITLLGDIGAPTAAQVSRGFANAPDRARILVGITRGGDHHVVVLERQR
jgi:hypothetical protein